MPARGAGVDRRAGRSMSGGIIPEWGWAVELVRPSDLAVCRWGHAEAQYRAAARVVSFVRPRAPGDRSFCAARDYQVHTVLEHLQPAWRGGQIRCHRRSSSCRSAEPPRSVVEEPRSVGPSLSVHRACGVGWRRVDWRDGDRRQRRRVEHTSATRCSASRNKTSMVGGGTNHARSGPRVDDDEFSLSRRCCALTVCSSGCRRGLRGHARRMAALLVDGLRHGAPGAAVSLPAD